MPISEETFALRRALRRAPVATRARIVKIYEQERTLERTAAKLRIPLRTLYRLLDSDEALAASFATTRDRPGFRAT